MSTSLIRRTALGTIAVTILSALAFSAAIPANAEPVGNPTYRLLPGAGSDTTQDLNNGLSQKVSFDTDVKVIGSYNATGGGTIRTNPAGNWFARPEGSLDGVAALSSAIQTGTETYRGVNLDYDDLKFASSSTRPSSSALNPAGPLQYIPLAVDAVTYATIDNTVIPSGIPVGLPANDSIGTTDRPAALTLRSIFRGGNSYIRGTIGTTTYQFYVGTGTAKPGWTKLDVYVPPWSSGTRTFWASTLGFSSSTLPHGVIEVYSGGSVRAHDGAPLVGNPRAIVPFSIAQYLGQTNSNSLLANYGTTVLDRRQGAVLNAVGASQPTLSGVLNPAFPIRRPVFTVVERAAVEPANAAYNPVLARTFVGTGAKVFGGMTITDYGFGRLANTGTTIGATTYIPGETPNYLRSNFTSIP